MQDLGVINALPSVLGVQSEHADPVYLYYLESDSAKRRFRPVTVQPSVAQAAMIGNPVSMPRVVALVERYRQLAGGKAFQVVEVKEQEIMDCMLTANRHGHITCTQGGECLAGLRKALDLSLIRPDLTAVLDATAHALKFAVFQEKYFSDAFEPEYEVVPKRELQNSPHLVVLPEDIPGPTPGESLDPDDFKAFVEYTARNIAELLDLKEN
jgi:threonine synthase